MPASALAGSKRSSTRRRARSSAAARGRLPSRSARRSAACSCALRADVDLHPEQVLRRSRRGSASAPRRPRCRRRPRVRAPGALQEHERLQPVGVHAGRLRRRARSAGGSARPARRWPPRRRASARRAGAPCPPRRGGRSRPSAPASTRTGRRTACRPSAPAGSGRPGRRRRPARRGTRTRDDRAARDDDERQARRRRRSTGSRVAGCTWESVLAWRMRRQHLRASARRDALDGRLATSAACTRR